MKENEKLSPMMRRYFEIKESYADCIVLFRLGDFYEMFFDDAIEASKILDITLTGRDCGLGERAPMCGVPHHAVENYIKRLIDYGCRVAICEQLSDPATSKGMVDRDVVRVITQGTIIEENILEQNSSNYLAAVFADTNTFGLAWADISTGEFSLSEYSGDDFLTKLDDMLSSFSPKEIVCNEQFLTEYKKLKFFVASDLKPRAVYNYAYRFDDAHKKLLDQFKVISLKSFECEDKKSAVCAAGGLLEYLKETQKRSLVQFVKLNFVTEKSYMTLDISTRKNLELTERQRDGKKNGSLLFVLDKTVTPLGARMLRRWIDRPLIDSKEIARRLDSVEELAENIEVREELSLALKRVRDLERLAGRVAFGSVSPRDCLSIKETLEAIPSIKEILKNSKSKLLKEINASIIPLTDVKKLLTDAINENSPANLKDGGYINESFNDELCDLKNIKKSSREWISNIEQNERNETGIKNLKIGYNRVFG